MYIFIYNLFISVFSWVFLVQREIEQKGDRAKNIWKKGHAKYIYEQQQQTSTEFGRLEFCCVPQLQFKST